MNKIFLLFDVVEFLRDLPAQKVKRGEKGTIVEFSGDDCALIELADASRLGLDKIVEVNLADIIRLEMTADMPIIPKSEMS